MTRAAALRLAASAATVVSVLASVAYVASHAKDAAAPLQPPVVRPAATVAPVPTAGRIRVQPGVRATELPAITGTHVS